MKKYLFLLLAAIFCLPSIGFAQFYSTIFGKEAKRQRSISIPFNFSERSNPAKKEKIKVPTINIHTAIELSIDEATGKTTARWEDGSTFDGYTYYGQINREGTITFADGSKYHGEWRFDRFHGVGTMEYADGSKYHGQWSFGKPDGQGTIIEPNGVKITLKFDEGVPRGKCIIQDVDGRLYTGRWSSGILREKSIKPLEE